jgi:hypothetical protein
VRLFATTLSPGKSKDRISRQFHQVCRSRAMILSSRTADRTRLNLILNRLVAHSLQYAAQISGYHVPFSSRISCFSWVVPRRFIQRFIEPLNSGLFPSVSVIEVFSPQCADTTSFFQGKALATVTKWSNRFREGLTDLFDNPRCRRRLTHVFAGEMRSVLIKQPVTSCKIPCRHFRIATATCSEILCDD